MDRKYKTTDVKLDFNTPGGIVMILTYLAIFGGVVVFLVSVARIGDGNLVDGLSKLWEITQGVVQESPELLTYTLISFAAIAVILALMRIFKADLGIQIILTDESIKWYFPFAALMKKVPGFPDEKDSTEMKYYDIQIVFCDMNADTSGFSFFYTVLLSNDERIIIPNGFIGYFEILEKLERSCPNAKWDKNSLKILDSHRKGTSLRSVQKEIEKQKMAEFKRLVPSFLERQKLLMKARQEKKTLFSELRKLIEESKVGPH
jgi:hypothetical protein